MARFKPTRRPYRTPLSAFGFTEGTGTSARSTMGGYILTAENSATAWNAGRAASKFTGTIGPDNPAVWSISFRLRVNAFPSPGNLGAVCHMTSPDWYWEIQPDGTFLAFITGHAAIASSALSTGVEYLITTTYSSANGHRLYINATLAGSSTGTTRTFTGFNVLGDPAEPANAYVGDLRFWNVELTAAEIAAVVTRRVTAVTAAPDGDDYAITGTTYYVSTSGSDSNNGTSPATAWATIAKAMTQSYTAGDALLFERGGTFYGDITKTPTASGGLKWTIGAYGSGARPCISSYKILNNAGGWTNMGANVWRIDITSAATHSGNTGNTQWNIGHLRVGDETRGRIRGSQAALAAQWEFYAASPYLYVYSAGNPTTVAASQGGLRAAPNGNVISARSNMSIADLELTGAGANGIAHAGSVAHNLWIRRNAIHHCGGSILVDQGNARYGNGVEAWIPSNNWIVENNDIYEIYDVATSVQGNTQAGTSSNNIVFRDNHCWNCSQMFEVWQSGGAGMYDIYFENNLCEDAGSGWGGPIRPNQDLRCHILAAATWETPSGATSSVTIRNNRFYRAASMYWFSYPSFPMAGITAQNNDIRLASGTKMHLLSGTTIDAAASWASANGVESGSTFQVVPP